MPHRSGCCCSSGCGRCIADAIRAPPREPRWRADRGGNQFTVTFFGDDSNLHRVWDSQLIERMELSCSELAAWLLDDIDRDLTWGYGYAWNATVEQRLAQAGVRTAAWLNRIFSAND